MLHVALDPIPHLTEPHLALGQIRTEPVVLCVCDDHRHEPDAHAAEPVTPTVSSDSIFFLPGDQVVLPPRQAGLQQQLGTGE